MKELLIITDVDFWNESAGHCVRIYRLVEFLGTVSKLTIGFIGMPGTYKSEYADRFKFQIHFFNENKIVTPRKYGLLLREFLNTRHFDIVIIEYIHNAHFLTEIQDGVVTILDAHDIISERSASFRKFDYGGLSYELAEEKEYIIFDYFDHIIFLCEKDYINAKRKLKKANALLGPHPTSIILRPIKEIVKNIGFVGSQYLPNKDAVEFLIREIWPQVARQSDVKLTIYGGVCTLLGHLTGHENIYLKGFTKDIDEIYGYTDILVNPVRFGAGIKIKNIEALANGIPLVTTTHASSGIERGIGSAFLIADSPTEFVNQLLRLINNYSLRKEISINAIKYAGENFTPTMCYKDLLSVINK